MKTSLPLVMLIAGGCVLCDLKDVEADSDSRVRSLPVMFGLRNTMLVTSVFLAVTAILSYYEHRLGLVVSSTTLIALTQFPSLLSLDAVDPLAVDAVLAFPGLLIVLHWV